MRKIIGRLWRSALPKVGASLDLGRYVEGLCIPESCCDESDWSAGQQMQLHGMDWRLDAQLALLESWSTGVYDDLFSLLRADIRINPGSDEPLRSIRNGFYPTPDAEIYAAMIQHFAPDQIIEVGGGYSTRIARQAISHAKQKTALRVIDPAPRAEVTADADEIVFNRIENTDISTLGLSDRSMFFIDSSHICRKRGDVTFLFCEVIPSLPAGTIVHLHDIYLPYDYPKVYDRRLWNEQYLLAALLSHSSRYRVLLSTHYLSRHRTAAIRALVGDAVDPDKDAYCGGSFWLRIDDN